MKKALAAGLLFVTLLSIPSIGFSATYYVPDNFGNIQAAIMGASGGDTVIVRNGIWKGAGNKNLDFFGKALTLRSQSGATNCIIDCENNGRGFYFHSGETSASVLDGFTIALDGFTIALHNC